MKEVLQEVSEQEQIAEACAGASLTAWLHLMRVHDKIQRHSMSHLECYGLTPAQYDVLAQLSASPGIPQQELAQRLLVTKGNVCGLIDRMSAHGLVERRADREDRRLNLLFLTERGAELALKAVPAYGEFIREHMAGLSEGEQRDLQDLLYKLDTFLAEH
jgi:DNA-binding MarR family transcriptional regulator